ncbi:hypothetical protein TNCV_508081 [Trichonephila clavipes]|nr:hypothetical protein TNCV_508081 [Trichonephila clavipes]
MCNFILSEKCRINIKFLVKLKKSARKTFKILIEAYGDETLSSAHVLEWYRRFLGGRVRAEDERAGCPRTATAGSDVVQSGRPIFDDFFQHLWPYIGNNTANVVFQIVKRL